MGKISIPERIREYRKERNISQASFGEILGVTAQAVSKWERGECYPDITFLPDLARVLSCSVSDFFE